MSAAARGDRGPRACGGAALHTGVAILFAGTLALACARAASAAPGETVQDIAADGVRAGFAPDSTLLDRARVQFDRAHFGRVVELLQPALAADSAAGADRSAALELLGRGLVRTGDVEGGVAAFTGLLDVSPGWTMDRRRVRDDERAVFDRARLAWREAHPDYVRAEAEAAARPVPHRAWYRQRRFQAAGGVTVAVVAAVVRHQRELAGSNDALPALPGHP
jgi:hypothetical protein